MVSFVFSFDAEMPGGFLPDCPDIFRGAVRGMLDYRFLFHERIHRGTVIADSSRKDCVSLTGSGLDGFGYCLVDRPLC